MRAPPPPLSRPYSIDVPTSTKKATKFRSLVLTDQDKQKIILIEFVLKKIAKKIFVDTSSYKVTSFIYKKNAFIYIYPSHIFARKSPSLTRSVHSIYTPMLSFLGSYLPLSISSTEDSCMIHIFNIHSTFLIGANPLANSS